MYAWDRYRESKLGPASARLEVVLFLLEILQLNYMENSIAVTYGRIAPQITAVIGPSQGLGTPEGFVPRSLV